MTITTNTIPTFKELVEFIKDVPNIDHEAVSLVRKAEKKSKIRQFGVLEELAEWLSGWQGSYPPRADNVVMSIFISNHGISDKYDISEYPKSNQDSLVSGFKSESSSLNQLCKLHNIGLQVFDLAMELPTEDITRKPAMEINDCITTILYGREAISSNPDLLCLGEAGIGNDTIALAMCCALFGGDIEGWLDPNADITIRENQVKIINTALNLHKERQPLEILRNLGGRDFAAMVGAIISARFERVPVILDGISACTAAALLFAISPHTIDHCYAAHQSHNPSHGKLLSIINKKPLLDLELLEANGCAAALTIPLIASAIHIHINKSHDINI